MREHLYILDAHRQPIHCIDVHYWAEWCYGKTDNRKVAFDSLPNGVDVSTVFLGIDHNFGHGPPVLFETMVFGGDRNGDYYRYSTWDQAVSGHQRILKREHAAILKSQATR